LTEFDCFPEFLPYIDDTIRAELKAP